MAKQDYKTAKTRSDKTAKYKAGLPVTRKGLNTKMGGSTPKLST